MSIKFQLTEYLPEVYDNLVDNAISTIEAGTGWGKTLAFPPYVAAKGHRIMVAVPTRAAARGAFEIQLKIQRERYLAEGLGLEDAARAARRFVGIAAEGEKAYDDETMIIYATSGHVRNVIFKLFDNGVAKDMDFCKVLMIDEVHQGKIDNTVIISLWSEAALQGARVPRLVLASATPPDDLNLPEAPARFRPPEIKRYPIEFFYASKDYRVEKAEELLKDMGALMAKVHVEDPVQSGAMLAFIPGKGEAEKLRKAFEAALAKAGPSAPRVRFTMISGENRQWQAQLEEPLEPGTRQIAIATNAVESSVTIDDLAYVFDSLLFKQAETSESGGDRLALRFVSKDSAKQRAGRTGRVRPGKVYRMLTQAGFDALPGNITPEIKLVPVHDEVIRFLDAGLDPKIILVDAESERKLQQSLLLLRQLKMIEGRDPATGLPLVTEIGRFANKFPLSVRSAAVLWHWLQQGYPPLFGVLIAALINGGSNYFYVPRIRATDPPEQQERAKGDFRKIARFAGRDELDTFLAMLADISRIDGYLDRHNKRAEKEVGLWSNENSGNLRSLKELLSNATKCIHIAAQEGYPVAVGRLEGIEHVRKPLIPILLDVFSDMVLTQKKANAYVAATGEVYRIDGNSRTNEFAKNPPPFIIALSVLEITSGGSSMHKVGFGVASERDAAGASRVPARSPAKAGRPRSPRSSRSPRRGDDRRGDDRRDKGSKGGKGGKGDKGGKRPKSRAEVTAEDAARVARSIEILQAGGDLSKQASRGGSRSPRRPASAPPGKKSASPGRKK